MQSNQQTETAETERRYDPETLRKVTALATRLQQEHQEHLWKALVNDKRNRALVRPP